MKYFEIEIGKVADDENNFWMCIKGNKKPTIKEANIFLAKDCLIYKGSVKGVFDIEENYAKDCYDFSNVDNWPIFV